MPDLGFASLRDMSDYLALIQNMEANEKKRVVDFYRRVGSELGAVLRAIIAGFLR